MAKNSNSIWPDYLDSAPSDEDIAKMPFPKSTQDIILKVLQKANTKPNALDEVDCAILFHFVKHQNEPRYSFVPKRYKTE